MRANARKIVDMSCSRKPVRIALTNLRAAEGIFLQTRDKVSERTMTWSQMQAK